MVLCVGLLQAVLCVSLVQFYSFTDVYILLLGFERKLINNLYFWAIMDFLRDIFINILSNAIWAFGGFLFARFVFLKKSSLDSYSLHLLLKKSLLVVIPYRN